MANGRSIDLGAIYGIEIQEEAVRIAETALRRMDQQMDRQLWEAFGRCGVIRPPRSSATIVQGNALRLDWRQILPPEQCGYVLGNPPFVGKQFMTARQKDDMKKACGEVPRHGTLDYACGWYFKAAEYVQGTRTAVGFVSTNSIVQGEQAGVLWNALFYCYNVKIRFAHRAFAWESEAPGKAHVHVVIVGFGASDTPNKRLYEYPSTSTVRKRTVRKETGDNAIVTRVGNISPYLTEGSDLAILPRPKPRCGVPPILFGNMPNDGGHLILDDEQKAELLRMEPKAEWFVRPFLGAAEFIGGRRRWCLWLKDAVPAELQAMPEVMKRVEAVRIHRLSSPRPATRRLASTPALFGEIRQPDSGYLFVPSVSSQRRSYIPMAFMAGTVIASNLRADHTRRGTVPFRRAFLGDAHGLGSDGLRAVEIGFPLLEQACVQQLSLAGKAQRRGCRPWRRPRSRCWRPAVSLPARRMQTFTILSRCRPD